MHDDEIMDISLAAEIKEESLDGTDFDSHLSDVETEDDGDVVVVDAEKTMQYLSGIEPIMSPVYCGMFCSSKNYYNIIFCCCDINTHSGCCFVYNV